MMRFLKLPLCLLLVSSVVAAVAPAKPNIILIYADDLGHGDLGCYGSKAIPTPHLDRLAAGGLRFTAAYATSATCTPSRFGLLTGQYPWREKGRKILPGDAPLLIPPGTVTLPALLAKAGYQTGVVGKWHLGLGTGEAPADWNGSVKPGPGEVGFGYHHIMAATGDRVPTVFVENDRVVNLDPADPIKVSYGTKTGNEPTGREHPELRKFGADPQHSDTITNGVSRIGFMSGGKAALWKDDELGDHFTAKALEFIDREKDRPFFLFFALHEPHVPRVPAARFAGKTGLGPRGDVIAQLDDHVGAVMAKLEQHKLLTNTMVILSSDNGPVLDDGYDDQAVAKNGSHTPAGPFSGGKYSKLEGGTRVPLIVSWPGTVAPGVSPAITSQLDFLASFAALAGQPVPAGSAEDSRNQLDVLLGKTRSGREVIVQEGSSGLALRSGVWKLIPPRKGAAMQKNLRNGNSPQPQLYHLEEDPAESKNLAREHPGKVTELMAVLQGITGGTTGGEEN